MCVTTLLHAAVVRCATCSCCRAGRRLCEWVTSIDTLFGTEAHMGAGAGAEVRWRFRQSGEVLCLGRRHGEAYRRHRGSLEEKGERTVRDAETEKRTGNVENEWWRTGWPSPRWCWGEDKLYGLFSWCCTPPLKQSGWLQPNVMLGKKSLLLL